ncbi:MAG: D-alanyl-D-alanine carboxypeptidase, partial [Acidimicrobiales bacterium]
MRNTPGDGRVVAKTGSLKEVYALAGWVTTVPGSRLTFVEIVNGAPKDGVKVVDDLAVSLTDYPRQGAPREAIGPKLPT